MRGIVIYSNIRQPSAMKFHHHPVISMATLHWQQLRLTQCPPQSRQPNLRSIAPRQRASPGR
eukprot:5283168-Amphidinium_carterae.1